MSDEDDDLIELDVRSGIPQVQYDVPAWIEVYKHGRYLLLWHTSTARAMASRR